MLFSAVLEGRDSTSNKKVSILVKGQRYHSNDRFLSLRPMHNIHSHE